MFVICEDEETEVPLSALPCGNLVSSNGVGWVADDGWALAQAEESQSKEQHQEVLRLLRRAHARNKELRRISQSNVWSNGDLTVKAKIGRTAKDSA